MEATRGKIQHIVEFFRTMQEKKLDNIPVISSPRGFGKSNLALYLLLKYLEIYAFKCQRCTRTWIYTGTIGPGISERCPKCSCPTSLGIANTRITAKDLYKYIAFKEDVFTKIKNIDPWSPIIADESVNFAMGEDWMFAPNKKIKRLFAQCRTKHLIIFLNIPKFNWLQKKYKDDMATTWFRILVRSVCLMMVPDLGEGDDSWHLKEFIDQLGTYNYTTPVSMIRKRMNRIRERHPCYYDDFYVPKIPDRIYDIYLEARNLSVFDDDENALQGNYHKLMCYNIRYYWKQLVKATEGRDYPPSTVMSHFLFWDRKTKKPIVSPESVRKYIEFIKKYFS